MQGRAKSRDFTIVIPTIRQESITPFLKAWEKEFKGKKVIVVEDNPEKSFELPSWITHYSWKEIDRELGKNSWVIARRSATIRSFGYLKAWKEKSNYILTLDDDCLPEKKYQSGGFLEQIYLNLNKKWPNDAWWNTLREDIYPRGFPYSLRKEQNTYIHHGLWSNIPDLDGLTQKKFPSLRSKPFKKVEKVPYGQYFPMSGMNLAFRREMIPAMNFLLMGEDNKGNAWPYDRFDDIWAGIFVKKICDHLGLAISSGGPSILHSRASNVDVNIQKEKSGIPVNEWLWKEVEKISLTGSTVGECYLQIAKGLSKKGGYWKELAKAMTIWADFFD